MSPREEEPEADSERVDAAWRDIVDNFGERALLEEPSLAEPVAAESPSPEPPPSRTPPPEWDAFVPPTPPPLPRPRGVRLAAWIGLIAAPLILLVLALTGWRPPTLITAALIAGFLGGFGYLVATMPREPREPWDDGAQV